MSFDKKAFIASEHEKICRRILGSKFDPKIFQETQRWIDRAGGGGHRYAHGHNQEAELYIREHWGSLGVEMYRIHVLADRLQDRLSDILKEQLNDIEDGKEAFPYFEKANDGVDPYCRRPEGKETKPADPNARITKVFNEKDGCENCGGLDGLTLEKWIRGYICRKCLERRGLDVCGRCRSLFASTLGRPLSKNDRFKQCPVCAESQT